MAEFTAKDVQALRQATGAGMMDAKKALQENDGDMEAAAQWLREKGLAKVAKLRRPREHAGLGGRGRRRQRRRHRRAQERDRLRRPSPTTSPRWCRTWPSWSRPRAPRPWSSGPQEHRRPEDRQEGEHRARARSCASRPAEGNILDTYLHIQDGRGVNARAGRAGRRHAELAHDIAVHIAFAKPPYLTPRRGPGGRGRQGAPGAARHHQAEGKPERPGPRSSRAGSTPGTRTGCCSSRASSRDDKTSISQLLGGATHRALRPGRTSARDAGRLTRPWLPIPPTARAASRAGPGPAQALGRGLRRRAAGTASTATVVATLAERDRRGPPRPRTSTSPSWSAAATSGGA